MCETIKLIRKLMKRHRKLLIAEANGKFKKARKHEDKLIRLYLKLAQLKRLGV